VQRFLDVAGGADEPAAHRLGIAVRIDSPDITGVRAVNSTTGWNCLRLWLRRPDDPRNIPQLAR
jgi:hypothetical protein